MTGTPLWPTREIFCQSMSIIKYVTTQTRMNNNIITTTRTMSQTIHCYELYACVQKTGSV